MSTSSWKGGSLSFRRGSINQLGRWNLTPSQTAAYGVELAQELTQELAAEAKHRKGGRPKKGVERIPPVSRGKTRDQVAAELGVNPHYLTAAEQIKEKAPEILEAVKQRTLTIPQAKKIAELPPDARPAAMERVKRGEAITEGGLIYRDGKHVPVATALACWIADHQLLVQSASR